MQSTLTLQLDDKLIQQAQEFAKQHGKSISQLMADYLAGLATQEDEVSSQQLPPITLSLLGSLRHANLDEQDYKAYLEEKYL